MVFVGVRTLETRIRYRQLLLPVELSSGTGGDNALLAGTKTKGVTEE